jgi:hypothetical protein
MYLSLFKGKRVPIHFGAGGTTRDSNFWLRLDSGAVEDRAFEKNR